MRTEPTWYNAFVYFFGNVPAIFYHVGIMFVLMSYPYYDLRIMSMECVLFETLSKQFLDHARTNPSFTLRPAKALKFSKLSQQGLRHTYMKCPLFGTISRPCFYHVKTTFGLDLLSHELEL